MTMDAAVRPEETDEKESVHIQIDEPFVGCVSPDWLRTVALATLRMEGYDASRLTVVVTDDESVRALNRTFRDTDAPTDVLSFGGDVQDFVVGPEGPSYLGDVVISCPRAQDQAIGHPVEAELALLVVHGVLHLLGYDHVRPGDKGTMWERQADVLRSLGLTGVLTSEDDGR